MLIVGIGSEKFEALYGVDLAVEAVDLELRWRQHLAEHPAAHGSCPVDDAVAETPARV